MLDALLEGFITEHIGLSTKHLGRQGIKLDKHFPIQPHPGQATATVET